MALTAPKPLPPLTVAVCHSHFILLESDFGKVGTLKFSENAT